MFSALSKRTFKRLPLVAVAVNVMLLAVLGVTVNLQEPIYSLYVFGLAQIIICLSHLIVSRLLGNRDIFEGLNVLNVGLFLHFFFAAYFIFYDWIPTHYNDLWNLEIFPFALFLIQLQMVMIQVGYYLIPRECRDAPVLPRSGQNERRLVAFIACILLFPAVVTLLPGDFQRSGIFIMIRAVALYLPFYVILLCPKQASLFTRIVVALAVGYSLWSSIVVGIGSKAGIVAPLCALVFRFHYFRRPLRISEAFIGLVFVIVLVTYANYSRAVGYLPGITWETINPFSMNNFVIFQSAGVSSLLTPLEAFLSLLTFVPDRIDFFHGYGLLEEMLYPLTPRIFFPNKPDFYGSAVFWEIQRGFLSLDVPVFESISLPGHFYLDFGITGVALGGLLVGVIQRVFYQRLVLDGRTPGSICLYGIVCSLSLIIARAFTWTTTTIITNLLFPYTIIWLLQSSRKSRRARYPVNRDTLPSPSLNIAPSGG